MAATGFHGGYWCAYIDCSRNWQSDTEESWRYQAGYGVAGNHTINVYANGSTSAGGSWSGSVYDMTSSSEARWHQCMDNSVTHARKGSDYTITASCTINVTGGFQNGSETAYVSHTVSTRVWYTPKTPTSLAVTRNSDTSHKLTWKCEFTDTDGGYPIDGYKLERSVDGGSWAVLATIAKGTSNATITYTDTSTSANHYYQWRVRAYRSSTYGSYSGTVNAYTTPAAPTGITLSRPNTTSVKVTLSGLPKYYDKLGFRRSSDQGKNWADITLSGSGTEWTDTAPPSGLVRYAVRACKGSLWSAWKISSDIQTLVIPNAPAVTSLSNVYVQGSSVNIKWTPQHPDGTAQTKAQVEVTDPSGTATTYEISGTATTQAVVLNAAGTWKFRVRTYGQYASYGAWSSFITTTAYPLPIVAFTTPTSEGEEVTTLPYTIEWDITDATGVAAQRLTLNASDGVKVVDASLETTARAYNVMGALGVKTGETVAVSLAVQGGSSLSVTETTTFTTNWAKAGAPTAIIRNDLDALTSTITLTNTDPLTKSMQLFRKVGDGLVLLSDNVEDGGSVLDPLPPLGVEYKYITQATTESGTTSQNEYTNSLDTDGLIAFNFDADAKTRWVGRVNLNDIPQHSYTVEHAGTLYHFEGDDEELPVWYPGGELDISEPYEFAVPTLAEFRELKAIARKYSQCWMRNCQGDRDYCVVTIDLKRAAVEAYTVSLTLTHQMWQEPYYG